MRIAFTFLLTDQKHFLPITWELRSQKLVGTDADADTDTDTDADAGAGTYVSIFLDLARCDNSAVDDACANAGGKPVTIKAAGLTCEAEGMEVKASMTEYMDCAGVSCPGAFDPSKIRPELLDQLEQEFGVTCTTYSTDGVRAVMPTPDDAMPPGDETSDSSRITSRAAVFSAIAALSTAFVLF